MTAAIHHVGLTVSDLERAITFWCEGLGCTIFAQQDIDAEYLATVTGEPNAHTRQAHLTMPGSTVRIELLEYVTPRRSTPVNARPADPGAVHVAVHCPDLPDALARLRRLGGEPVSEPITVDTGINIGVSSVYLRDPDGHLVELVHVPQ